MIYLNYLDLKNSEFVENIDFVEEDNVFLCKSLESERCCKKFPLIENILLLENVKSNIWNDFYNKKEDVIKIFEYDLLLDEFESDLNFYLNDILDFKLTYLQKEYFKNYLNFLRDDLNKLSIKMEEEEIKNGID